MSRRQRKFADEAEAEYLQADELSLSLREAAESTLAVYEKIWAPRDASRPTKAVPAHIAEYRAEADAFSSKCNDVNARYSNTLQNNVKIEKLIAKALEASERTNPDIVNNLKRNQEKRDQPQSGYGVSCDNLTARMRTCYTKHQLVFNDALADFWYMHGRAVDVLHENFKVFNKSLNLSATPIPIVPAAEASSKRAAPPATHLYHMLEEGSQLKHVSGWLGKLQAHIAGVDRHWTEVSKGQCRFMGEARLHGTIRRTR